MEPYIQEKIKEFEEKVSSLGYRTLKGEKVDAEKEIKDLLTSSLQEAYLKGKEEKEKEINESLEEEKRKFLEGFAYNPKASEK